MIKIALVTPESKQVWTNTGVKTFDQLGFTFDIKRLAIIEHLQSFGYEVYFEI